MVFRLGYWIDLIVRDVDETLAKYEHLFDWKAAFRWDVPDAGISAASVPIGPCPGGFALGGHALEILAPFGPNPVPQFEEILETRGEGFGMISIHFDDKDAEIKRMQEMGIKFLEAKLVGHVDYWLGREYTHGVLFEFGIGGMEESFFARGMLKNVIDPELLPQKGKIIRMGHLAHAVNSIDEVAKVYERIFGLKLSHRWELPDADINSAWIPVGSGGLKLVEPRSPKSPIARSIEQCGEGIDHAVLLTDDLPEMVKSLKAKGVNVIESTAGGIPDAWVPREYTQGMLYQIMQAKDYYSFFKWGKIYK